MSQLSPWFILGSFWFVVHCIRRFFGARIVLGSSTLIDLQHGFSLHCSTTFFNLLPRRLVNLFKRSNKRNGQDRMWALYWDLGAVIVIIALVVAQIVLALAAWKGLGAVLGTSSFSTPPSSSLSSADQLQVQTRLSSTLASLVKRSDAELTGFSPAADSLLLRPIIPGLTHSSESFPLMLIALFSAQIFHEFGHALAAASESVALQSIGFRLFLVLPTFYVELSSSSSTSSLTDLRIASAGVWHNLILVGMTYLISSHGFNWGTAITRLFYEPVEGGLLITEIDPTSPLYGLLPVRSIITHLDDLELDTSSSPANLWATYLLSPSTILNHNQSAIGSNYDTLGWCLDVSKFTSTPTIPDCCQRTNSSNSQSHELCFLQHGLDGKPSTAASTVITSYACLDPLTILGPPTSSRRCLDNEGCRDPHQSCAVLDKSQHILRIGYVAPSISDEAGGIVKDAENSDEDERRVVIYQGERKHVLQQISISTYSPRFHFIPFLYLRTIERFYSHLLNLSLALGFFNLLPLPHLDGAVLWRSLLNYLVEGHETNERTSHSHRGRMRNDDDTLIEEMELGFDRSKEFEEGIGNDERNGILFGFLNLVKSIGYMRVFLAKEGSVAWIRAVLRNITILCGSITIVTGVWVTLTDSGPR